MSSIFQSYYSTTHLADYSASSISWIGSLQAFFLFLFGALSGPLSDRLGVKVSNKPTNLINSQMVVIPAGATLVFAVMTSSLCTEYYQFILAQGVLGGITCGMIFTPVVSTIGSTLPLVALGLWASI
jgi:MFS family permease